MFRLAGSGSVLALLFLASVIPANAQSASETTPVDAALAAVERVNIVEPAAEQVYYDVKGNLSLHCDLPNEAKAPYEWKVNGSALEKNAQLAGRHALERGGASLRVVGRAAEDDFGLYSCAAGGRARLFNVSGRTHPRLPQDSNVVEGQRLRLQCRLVGKPYPPVAWLYSNETDNASLALDVAAALGDRARALPSEQGVAGGALLLEEALRGDAGRYWCAAGDQLAGTTLRVKDKYAALWPFLGICAEVFVLCAIILVYEKRRTKPELDDSDTDNHDQKKS